MKTQYHFQITQEAVGEHFAPHAMQVVLAANQKQDSLHRQISHPEFHFDDNAIQQGLDYIDAQRQIIVRVLAEGKNEGNALIAAWEAFGRLAHCAQDFYAHSNYAALWLARFPEQDLPAPVEIDPLDPLILKHPDLHTGRTTALEIFSTVLPFLKPLALRKLPPDTHLQMNLDGPERGENFLYACAAARKRTGYEYEQTIKHLSPQQRMHFSGCNDS